MATVVQIPFFPLVKKDLTFIHFGNDSRVDGLVNFEKLRMIAKEVRQVTAMSRCDVTGRSSITVSPPPPTTTTTPSSSSSSSSSSSQEYYYSVVAA